MTTCSLNMAWSQLFFGLRQPVPALVDIVALLGTVAALTPKMARVDRRTLFVFVPYVAWLSFAVSSRLRLVWLYSAALTSSCIRQTYLCVVINKNDIKFTLIINLFRRNGGIVYLNRGKEELQKAERKGKEQLDKSKGKLQD